MLRTFVFACFSTALGTNDQHFEELEGFGMIQLRSQVSDRSHKAEVFPSNLMDSTDVLVTLTSARNPTTYDLVSNAVKALFDDLATHCDADTCPQGEFAACVLRFAGHDFMDFKDGNGGSDGCVNFVDPDNNGLKPCLTDGEEGMDGKLVHLNDAWVQPGIKDVVSLADFLVIAGEAVMTRQRGDIQPPVEFKTHFVWGRQTITDCSDNVHLPVPEESCQANQKTFIDNLGLTWRQTAALMGVHTLGRTRTENSGFNGWWSDPVNSAKFNNNYYHSLVMKGWAPEEHPSGSSTRMQWRRVGDMSKTARPEIMLNTDMCLLFKHKNGDDIKAVSGNQCCAWVMPEILGSPAQITEAINENGDSLLAGDGRYCGFRVNATQCGDGGDNCGLDFIVKHWCCKFGEVREMTEVDCNNVMDPNGVAASDVLEFNRNEAVWLQVFQEAWTSATQPRPRTTTRATTTTTTRATTAPTTTTTTSTIQAPPLAATCDESNGLRDLGAFGCALASKGLPDLKWLGTKKWRRYPVGCVADAGGTRLFWNLKARWAVKDLSKMLDHQMVCARR